MKSYTIEKSKKKKKNCRSKFYKTITTIEEKLAQDTIKWLKFVVHYLNMKLKDKLVEIIDLQLCSSLK